MVIKRLFKGKGPQRDVQREADDGQHSLEDLIVLERYDEAEARLKAELKKDPEDLHLHLKLADVYTALGRREAAADEYVYVADEYGRDGFYDKGIALLARALKVTPGEERLGRKLYALEAAKGLEHKREAATDGLRANRHAEGRTGTQVLYVQRLWHHLAPAPLVQRMSPDQLRRLFAAVQMVKAAPGSVLAERGAGDPFLVIVASGMVEAVLPRADGSRTVLRTFTTGDLVGEAASLERGVWPAEYRIPEDQEEPTILLRLDREGVQHALTGNPDPKGFLESLRTDGNDRQIAAAVAKLEAKTK